MRGLNDLIKDSQLFQLTISCKSGREITGGFLGGTITKRKYEDIIALAHQGRIESGQSPEAILL